MGFNVIPPIILSFTIAVTQAAPLSQSGDPLADSSDVWASVVANVAPLMSLVGEFHAKEYMRSMSTPQQLLNMAAAPVGIISILVSAVRLTGNSFLRRLIGRDTEKKSEAMAQLTPVSTAMATPVYIDGRIETEPSAVKDAAFLCCHRNLDDNIPAGLAAFRQLWVPRKQSEVGNGHDFEIVLVLRNLKTDCSLQDMKNLVEALGDPQADLSKYKTVAAQASVSFRATGISPAQTVARQNSHRVALRDTTVAMVFALSMVSVQIAGYFASDKPQLQTLLMGIIGYLGIATGTAGLLHVIRSQVELSLEPVPHISHAGTWTTSNSAHTIYTHTKPLMSKHLITAAPADPDSERPMRMPTLALFLIASYVVYYLGIRVAPWWVGMLTVAITWLASAYRAVSLRATYTNEKALASNSAGEPWTGIPGSDCSKSLLQTLALSEPQPGGPALLLFASPVRISPGTWSSAQDMLKVGLELARQQCRTHICAAAVQPLAAATQRWTYVCRFCLVVYVPGFVFRCADPVDFVVEHQFTFDHLTRSCLKLLHVCLDQRGSFEAYVLADGSERRAGIDKCLQGLPAPVTPFATAAAAAAAPHTLRAFLAHFALKSLEQALVVPAAQLCAVYERLYYAQADGRGLESLQRRHVDNLALGSSGDGLPALQADLEERGIWAHFMRPVDANTRREQRPASAENYYTRYNQWGTLTGGIDGEERPASSTAVAVEGSN